MQPDAVIPGARLGSTYLDDARCQFLVWAPQASKVDLHLLSPREHVVSMTPQARGYHAAMVEDVPSGSLYLYRLNDKTERPDPASRSQPQGVHGPSEVIEAHFPWGDAGWAGALLTRYIIYELHVGVFTEEGTFDAIIPRLQELAELGITAIELMPVAQFPGDRNWGYDGVYPYAVHQAYGGAAGLKRLVNACHRAGLSVILDVVYNHLGPEGNYLHDFGPYFTDRYKTPWGSALNFDGPHSDEVRRFFIENALGWISEFHIDALRLDAVHAILDQSAYPFLQELTERVHRQAELLKRPAYVIAESALNDARLIRPADRGGYGMDAQWNDDFHHALRALLTGERQAYYQDYGTCQHLIKALCEGFVYSGEHSSYRQRCYGVSSRDIPADQFVVFAQNHDQTGNRMLGERLTQLLPYEGLKLAAGIVLLSPFIPLLFMGEEYGERAPFLYFISHGDPELIDAVRRGRREEFTAFAWQGEPPDPQAVSTFLSSKLNWSLARQEHHRALRSFYRELIRLRTTIPALASLSKEQMEVLGTELDQVLMLKRRHEGEVLAIFHPGKYPVTATLPVGQGCWEKILDSAEKRWEGPGSSIPEQLTADGTHTLALGPFACVLFRKTKAAG